MKLIKIFEWKFYPESRIISVLLHISSLSIKLYKKKKKEQKSNEPLFMNSIEVIKLNDSYDIDYYID